MTVIEGARTSGNSKPPSKFDGMPQPDRVEQIRAMAAERGLRLVPGRSGPDFDNHLIRVGAGGLAAEVTPVEGTSLDLIEQFLTQTSPSSTIEAMQVREGQTLLAQRAARPATPPEMTPELRNEPGPALAVNPPIPKD